MGTTFNKKSQKERRQLLRANSTLAEKILWHSLRGRQVLGFKFRRQHGIKYYIVDFYCPELKLAIEADGYSHEGEAAQRRDVRRQCSIEREGVRFLRFSDDEILGNTDKVIRRIEQEVSRLAGEEDAT
jgi:very-short-patch-repair endonuclease